MSAEFLEFGDSVEKLSTGFHWLQVMTKTGQGAHIGYSINNDGTATIHVEKQAHGPNIHPTIFTGLVEGWDEYGIFPGPDEGIKDITVRPTEAGTCVIGIHVWDPILNKTIGSQVRFDELSEYFHDTRKEMIERHK